VSLEKKLAKYPRFGGSIVETHTGREPLKCQQCGKSIRYGSEYHMVDIQHDFFRGNDDCVVICQACKPKMEIDTIIGNLYPASADE